MMLSIGVSSCYLFRCSCPKSVSGMQVSFLPPKVRDDGKWGGTNDGTLKKMMTGWIRFAIWNLELHPCIIRSIAVFNSIPVLLPLLVASGRRPDVMQANPNRLAYGAAATLSLLDDALELPVPNHDHLEADSNDMVTVTLDDGHSAAKKASSH